MPSTVYKGDLAEVTFGHETGIVIADGAWGGVNWRHETTGDISKITFTAGVERTATGSNPAVPCSMFDSSSNLKYPKGLLAGSHFRMIGGGTYSKDDHMTGAMYTIVHNEGDYIQVTPALKTTVPVAATVKITNTGAITADRQITLISTDGTSRTYIGKSDASGSALHFDIDGTDTNRMQALKDAIEHADGHNGKITVSQASGVLTLTQASYDGDGNTTITSTLDNTTITDTSDATATKFTGGVVSAADGDTILIGTLGTPSMDVGMAYETAADASDETVLTDQFVGLAATVTLPETSVKVLRSHIVGLGRNIAVQEPQSMRNDGGSLETMLHSARWFYYALGNEAVTVPTTVTGDIALATAVVTNTGAITADQEITLISTDGTSRTYIGKSDASGSDLHFDVDGTDTERMTALKAAIESAGGHNGKITVSQGVGGSSAVLTLNQTYLAGTATSAITSNLANTTIKDVGGNTVTAFTKETSRAKVIAMGDTYVDFANTIGVCLNSLVPGDYIIVKDSTEVLHPYGTELGTGRTKWTGTQNIFQSSERNETRRVLAVDNTTDYMRIYVDDPFNFDHAALSDVVLLQVAATDTGGSPHFDTDTASVGTIKNRQKRVMWSKWRQPSFSLESSMRLYDVDSYGTGAYAGSQTSNVPGQPTDSKQLTRIYKGCKIKSWNLSADVDAQVKMKVDFDAMMCYTDTGRLENSNKGDRFTAHRMFENVANSPTARKVAGIAPNTEKPFFYYNGTITGFGTAIAQVTSFKLSAQNETTPILTVGSNPLQEARNTAGQSLEQIPYAGSRNPSLNIEGKIEYELEMEIIPSDPLLWHEFRTNRVHEYDEPITLHLQKNGAGSDREEMYIIIDDYIITEAPLQIPDDFKQIKMPLKILPKHIKVVGYDTLLHA